jgi:erythromycin esterase-like protein
MNRGITALGLADLAAAARPLGRGGLDPLIGKAAKADFVLIGEASHGTRDFYELRADITRRLIREHGFTIIALEADWPDTLRLHEYAIGSPGDAGALDALEDFRRFPRWMWRNETMPRFLDWLREWNRPLAERQVGIFGIDLYSLHASIRAVLAFLERRDPAAAARARKRYGCFDHFGSDPQEYGFLTARRDEEGCEDEVVSQLLEMRRRMAEGDDNDFFALQNAKVVADAEQYYRAMFRGRDASWNLRDAHMEDTVRALARHYQAGGRDAKVIVWAHNSHLGDARATEMGRRGEWNLGQLLKQRPGAKVFNIGFSTYEGTVTAAHDWDGEPETMEVNPGLQGSYEELLHGLGKDAFWLDLREGSAGIELLRQPRLQRAIGVIYRPATERISHYYHSTLPEQFDALIHIDRSTAIRPLDEGPAPALDLPAGDPGARV